MFDIFVKKEWEWVFKNAFLNSEKLEIKMYLKQLMVHAYIRKTGEKKEHLGDGFINFDDITSIEKKEYKKVDSLIIHAENNIENHTDRIVFAALPGFDKYDEFMNMLEQCKNEYNRLVEEEVEEQRKRKEEREKQRQRKLELEQRRKDFFDTYVTKVQNNNPYYLFEEKENYATYLFVDQDRNIHIISVDKEKMEKIEAIIGFENIHYYEKAGTIHYVSDINVNNGKSFGGSFVPSKMSFKPVVVGTLLFGIMGMVAGALIGYEPAQFEPSSIRVNSTIQRIDERNVILNYYSEQKKQYMDIELPQEIYNFLQTYLPEKKYDIVIAAEKRAYLGEMPDVSQITTFKKKLSLEQFEEKIKKLKMMHDYGLIEDDEFQQKKLELVDSINC